MEAALSERHQATLLELVRMARSSGEDVVLPRSYRGLRSWTINKAVLAAVQPTGDRAISKLPLHLAVALLLHRADGHLVEHPPAESAELGSFVTGSLYRSMFAAMASERAQAAARGQPIPLPVVLSLGMDGFAGSRKGASSRGESVRTCSIRGGPG